MSIVSVIKGMIRCKANKLGFDIIKIEKNQSKYHLVKDIYGVSSYKMVDIREDFLFKEKSTKVISSRKTLLYYDRLHVLYQSILNIIRNNYNSPINILEVGVFKGGSSYFLASIVQNLLPDKCRMFSVDTFEGHSDIDIIEGTEGGHKIGSFNETDYDEVKKYLADFPFLTVIKNRIQDCGNIFRDVHLDMIHLDADIYEPIKYSLDYFAPEMNKNGIIVVDDYGFTTCPGAKRAVTEFINENKGHYTLFEMQTGQCILIKNSD